LFLSYEKNSAFKIPWDFFQVFPTQRTFLCRFSFHLTVIARDPCSVYSASHRIPSDFSRGVVRFGNRFGQKTFPPSPFHPRKCVKPQLHVPFGRLTGAPPVLTSIHAFLSRQPPLVVSQNQSFPRSSLFISKSHNGLQYDLLRFIPEGFFLQI